MVQIIGYNIKVPNGSLYYTLHATTMCAPFYTSEKIESVNPKWAELDVNVLQNSSAAGNFINFNILRWLNFILSVMLPHCWNVKSAVKQLLENNLPPLVLVKELEWTAHICPILDTRDVSIILLQIELLKKFDKKLHTWRNCLFFYIIVHL